MLVQGNTLAVVEVIWKCYTSQTCNYIEAVQELNTNKLLSHVLHNRKPGNKEKEIALTNAPKNPLLCVISGRGYHFGIMHNKPVYGINKPVSRMGVIIEINLPIIATNQTASH